MIIPWIKISRIQILGIINVDTLCYCRQIIGILTIMRKDLLDLFQIWNYYIVLSKIIVLFICEKFIVESNEWNTRDSLKGR